jgi:hypothetical protein
MTSTWAVNTFHVYMYLAPPHLQTSKCIRLGVEPVSSAKEKKMVKNTIIAPPAFRAVEFGRCLTIALFPVGGAFLRRSYKMPLIATSKPSGSTIPESTYVACIRGAFPGGLQPGFQGGKPQEKIVITVELDKRGDDGQRYEVNEVVTLSTNEKSTLRTKWLKPALGRDLTLTEVGSFDVEQIIGKCVLVQVIHKEKDGQKFARIGSVVTLPCNVPPIVPEHDRFAKPVLAERLWLERIVTPEAA